MNLQTIDVSPIEERRHSFVEERLGPNPTWEGYNEIDDQTLAQRVYGNVGFIHAQSAEVGRGIILIGQKLCEIKEDLPHGQFMECVKAEFGWSQPWAHQLMNVAERFSNHKSTYDLPSSAQVLALLASADVDDATVQQAADERWTVKETKQRLGGEKQRQRTRVQELKAALKVPIEIRQQAAKAEQISTRQLMDELELSELPKGSEHSTATHLFLKNASGWWKLPDLKPVDIPIVAIPAQPSAERIVKVGEAARLMGKPAKNLSIAICQAKTGKRNAPKGNGFVVYPHPDRGMCILRSLEV